MAVARTRAVKPASDNEALSGEMPDMGAHGRKNEAAGDLANASSQAMKGVRSSLHSASSPRTEAFASEVLEFAGESGHAI